MNRTYLLSAAFLTIATNLAAAQETDPGPESFPEFQPGDFPSPIVVSPYEAMDDPASPELVWPTDPHHDSAEPAEILPPIELHFDLAAVRNLPFGLTRIDDPALLEFLEYYATDGRRRITGWIRKSGTYRDMILAELEAADAPPELLWIVAIESNFNPESVSSAGATGLWQLMRETSQRLGLRMDRHVDQRKDPVQSTRVAIAKLLEEYRRYGNWPVALASYNAGHGHVRGELRESNATDFWELDDRDAMYGNARRYAQRAMAIAIIDQNRDAFDLGEIEMDAPVSWETVDVAGDVRLSLIAQSVDREVDEIRALNPELLADRTPPDAESWEVRIPAGTYQRFLERFDDLSDYYGVEHQTVTLRFGETIEDIGERYDISPRVLRSVNGLQPREPSPYLREIIVPHSSVIAPTEPTSRISVVVPTTRFDYENRLRVFYEVNAQDTISAIADFFGTDVYRVAAWNDLDVSGTLLEGMVLQLYVPADFDLSRAVVRTEATVTATRFGTPEYNVLQNPPAAAEPRRPRTYTVRRGDSVREIAEKFDVSVRDIIRWNDLDDDAMIVVGERLIVGR